MIRTIAACDRSAVEALREHLTYTDCELLNATIDGPFSGWIAVDNTEIVGYAIAFPGRTTILSELVVAPPFRREGHGRALVETVLSASRADRIAVMTPIENTAAKQLYLELGFECDEHVTGFYADGTDALRLVRRE